MNKTFNNCTVELQDDRIYVHNENGTTLIRIQGITRTKDIETDDVDLIDINVEAGVIGPVYRVNNKPGRK